jgi:hypothetical protein
MSTGAVELNPAQAAAFDAMCRRRHHVMANCGPGMGKTLLGIEIARACAAAGRAVLGTGSSDRVVANLVARGIEGANLQRVLSELKRMERGLKPTEHAKANAGLSALLTAIKSKRPSLLFIDECGLINAEMFDQLLSTLCAVDPGCFECSRVLLYMTGDFANQLPPVEGHAFIFSQMFAWIRSNTWFANLTQQHRFKEDGDVGKDVKMLLAAENRELEMYLGAHQRAYCAADCRWLAGLPTFVTSRQACELHIKNALDVLIDDRGMTAYVVSPPATHANSTASMTTEATFYRVDGWSSLVEVTTMGGPLKGTLEDGENVLIPNRHQCILYETFDVPESASATELLGTASVALGYRADADSEYEVVTVPLIHQKESVPCVTIRSVGFETEEGDPVLSCYLAFNAQGYEYPGTLAVGALGVNKQLPLSREALLVVATRTPDGPDKVLFHPALKLQHNSRSAFEAYRKQLVAFTPDSSGNGQSVATGKRPRVEEAAAGRPRGTARRRKEPDGLAGFLGRMS